jgi:hypothetical protein
MANDHDTRPVPPQRRNKISEQFAARLIELLESPAYRVLSRSALLVICRIEIELAHHGGNDNGRLPVTIDQFVDYGMDRGAVAPAIREAEALGFIKVTEHGRGGNAEWCRPNRFYLTFAYGRGSKAKPPTHEWRQVETLEQAKCIAEAARAAKDRGAVKRGRHAWRRRRPQDGSHPPDSRSIEVVRVFPPGSSMGNPYRETTERGGKTHTGK